MIINPIISLWIMIPISIFLGLIIFINSKGTKMILRFVLLLLIFVTNLRIMIYNGKSVVYGNNLDIIFVVDSTLSMSVEDIYPNRLEKVKEDISYIMDKTVGANYAAISFDNKSYIRMPMTKDGDAISASIDSIKTIDYTYANGSSITVFKNDLETLLESEQKHNDRKVIVYIFTDGEDTGDNKKSLSELSKMIDGGAVLGYGTTTGGTVYQVNYYGEKEPYYYYDNNYNRVIAKSKMDENNLKNMAKELGIDYIHMTDSKKIDNNIKDLDNVKISSNNGEKYSYKDTYYFITPIILILFLVELFNYRRIEI